MRVMCISKFPPIQGGVSTACFWSSVEACTSNHYVSVVTNAQETSFGFRQFFDEKDRSKLYNDHANLKIYNTTDLECGSYVPWANPFASKLLGLSHTVASHFDPAVIIGWYLEPYGLV